MGRFQRELQQATGRKFDVRARSTHETELC
jgi:hypothetical protein